MVVHDVYTVGVVVIAGVVIITPPVCLKHVEKNDKASDHNSRLVLDAFQGRFRGRQTSTCKQAGNGLMDKRVNRQSDRPTDRLADITKQMNRQPIKKLDRLTDRQTDSQID